MIKIKNLSHIYNIPRREPIIALKEINLEIGRGEFVTIIGSNGSGKSTLARHINGLLLPTSGDVWVKGMNTKDRECLWKIRQEVGMVFQNPDNQIVATTVEDDIAFGLENMGIDRKNMLKRVNWALQVVGLEEYKRFEPHLLSGGQKQRVAIAGAIAMHPSFLILDEPTAMLDPRGRKEVIEVIKKLNLEEGITVIFITHLMEEVIESNRVVVLNKGEIVLSGKPKDVFFKVDTLRSFALDIPQITELAFRLHHKGLKNISPSTLKVEEMVEQLCLYV
ncbi:MAG: energy-coupling factor transporter ATPase [Candidatus Caldatribacteriota bacterium]